MDGGDLICPACGGHLDEWRQVPSFEPVVGPRSLTLARCCACGTVTTLGEPVPEVHSSGAYGGGQPRGAGLASGLLSRFDQQRLGFLPPPPGRLIDAGAGRGRFVAAARSAGYDALGVEPSLRAVDPAIPMLGMPLEDAAIAPGSADIVTLWHVLEHVVEPARALEVLARWLAPGGMLLVGVPNVGSLQARLAGDRWYHLDLPRHRTHFTVSGVSQLIVGTGRFEVVSVHHLLLEHNPFGMWQSLVSLGTRQPSYLYNLLKRNAPLWSTDLAVTLAAATLLPEAVLLEAMAALARRGGTIAVLARRL